VTFDFAIEAAEKLKAEGVNVRVFYSFSVKPFDKDLLLKCASETNYTILVVEDHYPERGIYEAVCSAVSLAGIKAHSLAVHEVSRSGKPEKLLAKYKTDTDALLEKVKELTF
jgi:transketolase